MPDSEQGPQASPASAGRQPHSAPPPTGARPPHPQHRAPAQHVDQVGLRVGESNAREIMHRLLRGMDQQTPDGAGHAHTKATDLHLNAGRPPDYRIGRVIRSVATNPLTQQDVVYLANAMLTKHQQERFQKNHCIDFSYQLDNDRFRINIVQSLNGQSISIRRFEEIKKFAAYNLPQKYLDIAEEARGFVIMSGSTGSGKTTSIAAMLDHVNRNFHRKIVTIEDPIEYVYVPKKSIIIQIEIGEEGIPNEDVALRNLVRMDPDAGLAGEMRDRHSLEAALKTAQAGHLIFGTLHCEGVGQSFDRILAYYDNVEQKRILGTLSDNLAAIINQRLLPCLKPEIDVVPAYEIFIPNPLTRRYIRKGKYTEATLEMHKPAMREIGCVTYVDSLHKLVTEEWIDYHVAIEHAGEQAEKLKARLKGIDMN